MKIYDDTKIYVLAPANTFTGGPLALHQLASALKRFDLNVQMVYYNAGRPGISPVHENFRKFHLPFSQGWESVVDDPKNIVIFPEIQVLNVSRYPKSRIGFYWLSVDLYIRTMKERLESVFNNSLALQTPIFTLNPIKFSEFYNLAQSEYSRQFLLFNKIPEETIFSCEDYLDLDFVQKSSKIDLSKKENIIAYNPKKGFEFTEQLIESAKDINFVPIRNMTPEQVQDLLARAKIYIDFGNHPGKDRIPREAAMSHCVVITDKKGSAGNSIDVPIDDDFKFVDDPKNIPSIIEKIRYVFENFQTEHDRQNSYRDVILNEQNKFFKDVSSLLENTPPPPYTYCHCW